MNVEHKNIIFGDGDLAKELFSFAKLIEKDTRFIGKRELEALDLGQLGKTLNIYLAYSDPEVKARVGRKLRDHDLKISSFIHETVIIGENVKLGEGVICFPFTIVSNDTTVGDLVFINCSCNVGHHVIIGDYTSVMSNSSISGLCKVGAANYLGTGSILTPKVITPEGLKLAVGSALVKSPKKGGTYHGNPASRIF